MVVGAVGGEVGCGFHWADMVAMASTVTTLGEG